MRDGGYTSNYDTNPFKHCMFHFASQNACQECCRNDLDVKEPQIGKSCACVIKFRIEILCVKPQAFDSSTPK